MAGVNDEKQKPAPAPKARRGKLEKPPVDPHYGEMQPVKYGDTPGKKLGNWLFSWLTPWQR